MNINLQHSAIYIILRGFIDVFSRRVTDFNRQAKHFELNFFIYSKNFPLDSQTKEVKSSS